MIIKTEIKKINLKILNVQPIDANEMRANGGGGKFVNALANGMEIGGGALMMIGGVATAEIGVGEALMGGGLGLAADGFRNLVNDV